MLAMGNDWSDPISAIRSIINLTPELEREKIPMVADNWYEMMMKKITEAK